MESVVVAAMCGVAGVAAGPMVAAAATRATSGQRLLAPGWWSGRGVNRTLIVAATSVVGAGTASVGGRFGSGAQTVALCWLVGTGVALALADWRSCRLPNVLVVASALGGMAVLLVGSVATGSPHPVGRPLIAALVVLVPLLMLAATGQFGYGDVKFGGVLGGYLGWFGWWYVMVGMMAGLLIGAVQAAVTLVGTRSRRARVPLGPALLVGSVGTLLVAGSACSGPAPAEPTATGLPTTQVVATTPMTSERAPLPTETHAAVEQRVRAAYIGMWMAMAEAGRTSDWQSPQIARYARDDALVKITQSLYSDHERGITARGRPVLTPEVTDLVPADLPTEARVVDCGDDRGWKRYDADGLRVRDEPGGRRQITAVLRLEAGTWKVTNFAIREVGSC